MCFRRISRSDDRTITAWRPIATGLHLRDSTATAERRRRFLGPVVLVKNETALANVGMLALGTQLRPQSDLKSNTSRLRSDRKVSENDKIAQERAGPWPVTGLTAQSLAGAGGVPPPSNFLESQKRNRNYVPNRAHRRARWPSCLSKATCSQTGTRLSAQARQDVSEGHL